MAESTFNIDYKKYYVENGYTADSQVDAAKKEEEEKEKQKQLTAQSNIFKTDSAVKVKTDETISLTSKTPATDVKLNETQKKTSVFLTEKKSEETTGLTGLTIEKTTKTEKPELKKVENKEKTEEPKKDEKTENVQKKEKTEQKQPKIKIYSSANEIYNDDEYKKANSEKKQEIINNYVSPIDKINQKNKQKQQEIEDESNRRHKDLCDHAKNGNDFKYIAKATPLLSKKHQIEGERRTLEKANEMGYLHDATMGQAEVIHKFAPENQRTVYGDIIKTGDLEANKVAVSHFSDLAAENQTAVVQDFDKANIGDDNYKKDCYKSIVDQLEKFKKENKLSIYEITSNTKYSEITQYTASNAWKLDKDLQAAAVKITVKTGDEKAINAASAQYSKYDASARDEIKSTILSTNYTSAHETLAKAEVETQTQTNSYATKEEASKSTTSKEITSSEDKVNAVKELIKDNNANSVELKESIRNLSDSEKIALIRQCPDNQNVLWAIFDTNPSLEVLAEIGKVMDIRELKQSRMAQLQFGFFDSNTQMKMLENSNYEELKSMNRNELNIGIRTEYDKLLRQGEKEKSTIG